MILSLPVLYVFFYEYEPMMDEFQARHDAKKQQELILTGKDPSLTLETPAAGQKEN